MLERQGLLEGEKTGGEMKTKRKKKRENNTENSSRGRLFRSTCFRGARQKFRVTA